MKTYEMIFERLSQTSGFITGEQLAEELKLSRTAIWKAIQTLDSKGIKIEAIKNRGYRWLEGDLLLTSQIEKNTGLKVYYNPKSASTQTDAKIGIERGNPAPALYLANHQTQAKGRFGRPFYAKENGGIYMSLHLKPNLAPNQLPAYTLMVAASIIKAIRINTPFQPQIKWVNDIYLDKKKIAGILTEAITSVETGLVTDVIMGVGLNFAISDFPEDLKDKAGSLFKGKPSLARHQLISNIWQIFFQTAEQDLLDTYKAHSLVMGKEVGFTESGKALKGQVLDIDKQGKLTIQLEDGTQKYLLGGEISLTSW